MNPLVDALLFLLERAARNTSLHESMQIQHHVDQLKALEPPTAFEVQPLVSLEGLTAGLNLEALLEAEVKRQLANASFPVTAHIDRADSGEPSGLAQSDSADTPGQTEQ